MVLNWLMEDTNKSVAKVDEEDDDRLEPLILVLLLFPPRFVSRS